MNKITISNCKYIFAALLILCLSSCNNSGSGTNTGMQNTIATSDIGSNIGMLPSGSVVYSSSYKYIVPANKTTSGTFILSDGKNENGVFEVSVKPANNQNNITKLPSVKVLSDSRSKTHGVYSVEINANNSSPGKYIMTPEFISNNEHPTKLNSLVLEITNSTQNTLKTTTTSLKEETPANNPGNLSIAFIYSQNRHIPQLAIVTLSNSHNVNNLPVNISILGKKGIIGDNINTICSLSSSVPNNSCYVNLPNDSTWIQGILTVSANGYTSVSKRFLRDGYLTLQVNNNIVANNQKNILTVNLVNSENVLGLPVIVSIEDDTSGAIGISHNMCTLSTNTPSCNVDLYGINPSNSPMTIKAYVQGTDQGNTLTNVYEPATDAVNVISYTTIASLTAYSLGGINGVITGHDIAVTMPFGTTNVESLVATFTTTGVNVSVESTTQISGVTPNNFTNPVVYTVTAADGSTQNYTVTVSVASSLEMTSFSLTCNDYYGGGTKTYSGDINSRSKFIINGEVFGSIFFDASCRGLSNLIATFTSTGTSVTVGGVKQVSGVTPNNFTNNLVVYTVTGADGSKKMYIVFI